MEREATSGYHRLNRPLVRSVQIPSGKCRINYQGERIVGARPPPSIRRTRPFLRRSDGSQVEKSPDLPGRWVSR
jgi:hypothetical protein